MLFKLSEIPLHKVGSFKNCLFSDSKFEKNFLPNFIEFIMLLKLYVFKSFML